MPACYGGILTKDVEAPSAFEAAALLIDEWSRVSEYNPKAVITVEVDGKVWRVQQAGQFREWLTARNHARCVKASRGFVSFT